MLLWQAFRMTVLYSSMFPLSTHKSINSFNRHEIAFVFGQILSPHSVPSLLKVLQNPNESDMVRHEAAEALGGIATPEVLPHLREWMDRKDAPIVVRESCQVAIDMWEVGPASINEEYDLLTSLQHENSNEFQYANGLSQIAMG